MRPKQQQFAATTIVLLGIVVLVSMITTPHSYMTPVLRSSQISYNDLMDAAYDPNEEIDPKDRDYGTCEVKPAVDPGHPVTPTFTASYPGSGAKMTWNFIEALTGIVTGDDFQLNGHANVVSIKTHYPSHEGREIAGADEVPRAMLLVRHPLFSIPSYFNFLYEYENGLEGHSTRAPLEEWIKWRNDNFDRQLQVWRRHTEYWMDNYDKLNRLVISYEHLTSDKWGPKEALRIGEFLSRNEGVTVRNPEEIPCVWYTVIKYKKSKGRRRRLQEQQEVELEQQAPSNTERIQQEQPQEEVVIANEQPVNELPLPRNSARMEKLLQLGVPGDSHEALMTLINPPEEATATTDTMVEAPPMVLDMERIQQEQTQEEVVVANEQQLVNESPPPPPPSEMTPAVLMEQQPENGQEQEEPPPPQEQLPQEQPPQEQQQQPPPQEGEAENNLTPLTGIESNPNDPHSKRGGPKYIAPYNERQLKDMIQVLTQLLERYRDDKALAPILVSYIDTVAERAEGPPEDTNTVVIMT
jgi:hypothetical protein